MAYCAGFTVVFLAMTTRGVIGVTTNSSKCDFDKNQCGWSNFNEGLGTTYNWTRVSASDVTSSSDPDVDPTAGVSGSYMMVQLSSENKGSEVRLYSEEYFGESRKNGCFSFWYNMQGDSDMGKLIVFVQVTGDGSPILYDYNMWELQGPSPDKLWRFGQFSIPDTFISAAWKFVVIFDAFLGSGSTGFFAIDDTLYSFTDCVPQTAVRASPPVHDLKSAVCDFDEGNLCEWTPSDSDFGDYRFTITDGRSIGLLDHTSGEGKYIYANSSATPDVNINIITPYMQTSGGVACFSLWYSILDKGKSELLIILMSDLTHTTIGDRDGEGNDGDWRFLQVNLQSDQKFQLLISAAVGDSNLGSIGIDDIKLTPGACPRSETIDFETNFGDLKNDSDTKWRVIQAKYTMREVDVTENSADGHFLQVEFLNPNVGATSKFETPFYPAVGDECLSFWCFTDGAVQLKIFLVPQVVGNINSSESSKLIWTQNDYSEFGWSQALADVSSSSPYKIVFQATVVGQQRMSTAISLDDISFSTNPCPKFGSCDFERGQCSFEAPQYQESFWHIEESDMNGFMPVDQTTKSDKGHYMVATFEQKIVRRERAVLETPNMQPTNDTQCLSFWYYGAGTGTLRLLQQPVDGDVRQLEQRSATPTILESRDFRSWKNMHVDVPPYSGVYQLVLEADSQDSSTSFAVDDVTLIDVPCADVNDTQVPAPKQGLDSSKKIFGCDFENSSFCKFSNGEDGNLNWKLFSYNTVHANNTGVNFDHTLNDRYGHHIYMDARGQTMNATAYLVSQTFTSDTKVCLSFYYVMNGRDVNRLNVYVAQPSREIQELYWTRAGNQGEEWKHQMVEIGGGTEELEVIFEGVVGYSSESDIDLDDIWVYDQACPPPDYCDFEDSGTCQMNQDNMDARDWTVQLAKTVSGTGPPTDHTYGTEEGHYLYMDMSNTKPLDEAKIATGMYDADTVQCLSFWYHMSHPLNSTSTHKLFILTRDERGVENRFDELEGSFTDEWNPAYISIPQINLRKFQIVFEGVSAGSEGDLALDDIKVSDEECYSYVNCAFETDNMCNWEPSPGYNNPAWTVMPGEHYMSVSFAGRPTNVYEVSKVQSQAIPVDSGTTWCLTMNYIFIGDNVGNLNITIQNEYPEPFNHTGFTGTAEYAKTWATAYVYSRNLDLGIFRFVIAASSKKPENTNDDGNSVPDVATSGEIRVTNIQLHFQYCGEVDLIPWETYPCGDNITRYNTSSVCNFMNDCPPPYKTDEENCGECDFETGYCNWLDDSEGPLEFSVSSGITGGDINGTRQGHYVVVGWSGDFSDDYADFFLNQQLGPSPYGCTMSFAYYMNAGSGANYGDLYVVLHENDEDIIIWRNPRVNSKIWHRADVDIGSIHTRFQLHFRARQKSYFEDAMGIDDIKFSNCMFPERVNGPCLPGQFKCKTGACIDGDKICDFTDECGDSSDEDSALCGSRVMDDFEYSFGDWSQDDQDDFDWSRQAGQGVSIITGPHRDNTLGTYHGHYLLCEARLYRSGQTARLISPVFQPTHQNCSIRFFYHMYGINSGELNLYIRKSVKGEMERVIQYITTTIDNWHPTDVFLTSEDNFQIVLEGKVLGLHSSDIGIDDVSFTPGCELAESQNLPEGVAPITPSPLCHSDQLQCTDLEGNVLCVNQSQICDFLTQCSSGFDEMNCGTCDFESGECGWYDESLGYNMWGSVGPGEDASLGRQGKMTPQKDHTLKETGKGHFLSVVTGLGESSLPAVLIGPDMSATGVYCTMTFFVVKQGQAEVNLEFGVRNGTDPFKSDLNFTLVNFSSQHSTPSWERHAFHLGALPTNSQPFIRAIVENPANDEYTLDIDDIAFDYCLPGSVASSTQIPASSFPSSVSTTAVCQPHSFRCLKDRTCIDTSKHCDGVKDCTDGSDENDCEKFSTSVTGRITPTSSTVSHTHPSSTTVSSQEGKHNKASSQGSNSDNWQVPVGVVLGLVAVAAIVVGVIYYLRCTGKICLGRSPLPFENIEILPTSSSLSYKHLSGPDNDCFGDRGTPMM